MITRNYENKIKASAKPIISSKNIRIVWVEKQTIPLADLFKACYSCSKNKRNSINALAFELNLEEELIQLKEEIESDTNDRAKWEQLKARPRRSKNSNQKLRDLLFMCSRIAYKYNQTCKPLLDRIEAKRKSEKRALIVVCNRRVCVSIVAWFRQ